MRLKLHTIVCLLVLASCAPQKTGPSQADIALGNYQTTRKQCDQIPLNPKTAIEIRDCIDQAFLSFLSQVNYPYMPLVLKFAAENKDLAIQYSKGKLDQDEYKQKLQVAFADFSQQEANMRNYDMAVYNERVRASNEHDRLVAEKIMQDSITTLSTPLPQPQKMGMTDCNMVGQTMSCISY